MLSEQDIKQAHPEAFDFVYGNLPAAKRVEFNRHLASHGRSKIVFRGLDHGSWRMLRCDHERRAGRGHVTKLR